MYRVTDNSVNFLDASNLNRNDRRLICVSSPATSALSPSAGPPNTPSGLPTGNPSTSSMVLSSVQYQLMSTGTKECPLGTAMVSVYYMLSDLILALVKLLCLEQILSFSICC